MVGYGTQNTSCWMVLGIAAICSQQVLINALTGRVSLRDRIDLSNWYDTLYGEGSKK